MRIQKIPKSGYVLKDLTDILSRSGDYVELIESASVA